MIGTSEGLRPISWAIGVGKAFLLLSALYTSLLHTGCKEPELVGIEVLPDDGYGVAWEDTFSLEVVTTLDDSIITSNTNSSTYLLGEMNDPVFGVTRSEYYTQFKLPASNLTFLAGSQIDSIVLNIAYGGAYGDVSKWSGTQRFGVYQLEDVIYDTTTYYSNVVRQYGTTPLAQVQVRPNLVSEVRIATDTLPPSLRVRLDNAFGQAILDSDPLSTLTSDTSFSKVFKGLAVVPENMGMAQGQGGILYLNIASGYTRVELYYTDTSSKSLMFPINATCASHVRIEHEHPLSITSLIDEPEAGKQQAYVQSMAGLKMRIKPTTINDLRQLGHVAINRAELVLPLVDGDFGNYIPPLSLTATESDSSGRSLFIVDQFEIEGHIDGEYRAATREYVFNVARHVQDILSRPDSEPYYGLLIGNSGTAVNARRAVFNGPQQGANPMKLRLTYTIIQ